MKNVLGLFYFIILMLFTLVSQATVTFDGDDGVHVTVIQAGGCMGCHTQYDDLVGPAPTAEVCDTTLVYDDAPTNTLVHTPLWGVSSDYATTNYTDVFNCRTQISTKIDHFAGATPSWGDFMPQVCDPANPTTTACLTATQINLFKSWVSAGAPRNATPTVTTDSSVTAKTLAGNVGQGATFGGTIKQNGSALTGTKFFYSTASNLSGASSIDGSVPAGTGGGNSAVAFSGMVSGLACNTLYYFRGQGTNGVGGPTDGPNIRSFTTSACTSPTITEMAPLSRPGATEDIPDTFTLNATDPDVGTLTWSISDNTSVNGEAVVNAPTTGTSTTITYTPTLNYVGADSFKVRVTDEAGGFAEITVNVTVNAASDPPTITEEVVEGTPIVVAMSEDSNPTAFTLSLTGEDPDAGTTLYWRIDAPASNGVAMVTGTTAPGGAKIVTYVPNANINGMAVDSFVVGVYDTGVGLGLFDQITVNVTIAAVNDSPTAFNDVFEVLVNSSGNSLDVLTNDTDVDIANEGDTKEILSVSATSGGGSATLTGTGINNTITYSPAAAVVGSETFSYTMKDSFGVTSMAMVTVSPPDTDGDGVFDYIDNCPATQNGPLGGADNQADNDADQVINVNTTSNPANPLVGGDACDTDDDNDGMLDADELMYPGCLDPFNAADATQDCDGDGVDNITEVNDGDPNTEPDTDNVGPVINAPADITIDATGLLTVVDLGIPTGNDGNDGVVTTIKASVNATTAKAAAKIAALETPVTGCQTFSSYTTDIKAFRPGNYTVIWASCDSAGNAGHAEQTVNIKPLVGVTQGQSVGEGQAVNINVALNGEAIAYPATVEYTVAGTASVDDHDATAGTVTFHGPGDKVRVISFNTLTDTVTESDESVVITLHSPVNIALGEMTTHTVTITEANLTPHVSLLVTQPGAVLDVNKGNTIYQADGAGRIVAQANDANGDALSFDWSATNASLLAAPGTTVSASQIDFDPAELTPGGLYKVSVTVSDGTTPVTSERLLLIKVAEATVLLFGNDSDDDGVVDSLEGYGDDDADGIPNYIDKSSTPSHAIENQTLNLENSVYIETDPGLKIAFGEAAIAAQATGILIDKQDVIDFGGVDGASVINAVTDYTFLSGLLSFEVSGLTDAIESVNVVIPLQSAIQANSTYRKYHSTTGWFDFVVDDKNELRSAAGNDGSCPAAGSAKYSKGVVTLVDGKFEFTGLTPGDLCLQLTIQDGGANDADGIRNFVVKDPGGLAVAPKAEEVAVASKANGRIGSVSLWSILCLCLAAIFVWRIRGSKTVTVA